MSDGRINNGGARKGAGRKPKAEEIKIKNLTLNAIQKVYGSPEEMWESIANESKQSFPHLKLMLAYLYGKPKEYKEHDFKNLPFNAIINEFHNFSEEAEASD